MGLPVFFIAGKSGKKPLKARVKRFFYKHKRKRMEKRIVPGAHTLEEVVAYAKGKYRAVEKLPGEEKSCRK